MIRVSLLLLFFGFGKISGQPISFVKEEIVFLLDSEYFSVNAIYYFVNNSNQPGNFPIFYPLPFSTDLLESIEVFDLEKNRKLPYISKDRGVTFDCFVPAGDTLPVNINYRHKHDHRKAEYILTSTSTWKKPLEKATFIVNADANIHISGFSYKPDSSYSKNGREIYTFHKVNFMPEKNFIINFE
jgi:hypothetical protein